MKFKSYLVVCHCAVISVLVLLFLCASTSIVFAEDSPKNEMMVAAADDSRSASAEVLLEEESIEDSYEKENLIQHAYVTQPKKSYIEIDGYCKTYMPADGSTTYTATPFLFRTNIAKNTDWWIASDLITKQYPNLGINDIVTGLKWNFRPGNPSIALIGGAQLNTAGGNVGDHAFEPQAGIALGYDINPKWETAFNVIYKYLWDSTARQRYNQYSYVNETYYNLNKKQKVSLGFAATCPNAAPSIPKGVNVTKVFAGYFWHTKENANYSIHIAKGLSFVDINWAIIAGVGFDI